MSRLPVLAITLGLAACTNAPTVGGAQAPIIGGTTDTGDPSVVLLFAHQPGSQSGALCTGEVVSPHVVMTAAHCVSPTEVGAGAEFVVYVGTDFNQATAASLLAVKETHFNQLFNPNQLDAGNDIGVAILASPAPVAAIPMNRTPLDASFVGKPVRFVGYGLDDATTQTGAGVKRTTTTTLSDYSALLVHFTDGLHETCNGDSGGPAFMTINGQEQIVGITSYGDVNCNQGGYDSRVDALVSFVDPYVQANDPAAAAPDAGAPPDLAKAPPPPSTVSTGTSGSSDPSGGATGGGAPSGSTPAPSSPPSAAAPSSGGPHGVGEPCQHDHDCASGVCGLGNRGTPVCVAANASAATSVAGCSVGGGGDARVGLALLVLVALALGRSLRRRDDRRG